VLRDATGDRIETRSVEGLILRDGIEFGVDVERCDGGSVVCLIIQMESARGSTWVGVRFPTVMVPDDFNPKVTVSTEMILRNRGDGSVALAEALSKTAKLDIKSNFRPSSGDYDQKEFQEATIKFALLTFGRQLTARVSFAPLIFAFEPKILDPDDLEP